MYLITKKNVTTFWTFNYATKVRVHFHFTADNLCVNQYWFVVLSGMNKKQSTHGIYSLSISFLLHPEGSTLYKLAADKDIKCMRKLFFCVCGGGLVWQLLSEGSQ